ncbi:spermidine/putrescine transport system ATP-binding protein [Halopenitus malekzadehii]|uniref:Molybdate/tungstate import ATP-binding protein WtpC n=1 Tax=Halopenitus malekzadehii TaxID=1267564 RepID=A0A1H6I891_9EURY|nr:ABC transporter ATP-binding protein [Halopenitus malekzadehii]SEH42974.1 spermidine/putrescine transport system ATP-binding protein [Halopenitus malekzadehii]
MAAALTVDGVIKRFGDVVACDDVSFELEQGEFFSLLGPSGSGKTTTLRIVSGFETQSDGTVHIDGEVVNDVPPNERDVNLVFQELALFSHLTVRENLAYGLKRDGVDAETIDARVAEYLELVDLAGYEDRDVRDMSGGQQQRVALARALIKEPPIVLLDEPLASLDRKLRKELRVELARIQSETGVTFFYVTHDQESAMSMSDRLAIMRDGKIQQIGTPEEVYDEPANPFVADFIGDANAFSGRIGVEDGVTTLTDGDLSLPIPDVDAVGEATVVVRPEHVRLHGAETDGLAVRITNKEYHGSSTRYIATAGRDRQIQIESDETGFEIGDEASVTIDDVRIFE